MNIATGTTPIYVGDLLRVTAKVGDEQGLSSGTVGNTGSRFQIPRRAWTQITETSIHADWAGMATARACNICDNFAIDMISVCCGTPSHILCWQGLYNNGVHMCPRCHKRTQSPHQGCWHAPQQPHSGGGLNCRRQPTPKRFPRGPRFHDFDVESDDPSSSSSINWKVCESCDRYLLPHNTTGYCRTCWEQVRGPASSEVSTQLTDTPCGQCSTITSGLQGEGTGEFKGEFFCSNCWTAWYSDLNLQNTA